MPKAVRKSLALLLAILAVLSAGIGLSARTAQQLINTPEPLQRILGPLATHEQLREILPQVLGTQLTAQIAGQVSVPIPAPLTGLLEKTITASSGALLNDAGFATAWSQTIENTRRDYVQKLADAKTSGATQATIELDLAPLLTSAYGTLQTVLIGSLLGSLLPDTLDVPQMLVDTQWPAEQTLTASAANRWLDLAGAWGWFVAAAGLLAIGALCMAPRGFRGKTLIAVGIGAVVAGSLVIIFGARLATLEPHESELTNLVINQLVQGVRAEVQTMSNTLIIGGVLAFLAGLGTWLWRRENPVIVDKAPTPVAD